VFDRFWRADKGRARADGGTGLGLAIVRQIAESHGGQVRLQSKPGVGSSFVIWLPEAAPASAPAEANRVPGVSALTSAAIPAGRFRPRPRPPTDRGPLSG